MKTRWNLILICIVFPMVLSSQTQYKEELAIETEMPNIVEEVVLNPSVVFEAEYKNRKIYFKTTFGIDNRAVIEIYSSTGNFVISLNVESMDEDVKEYVWDGMDEYGYKFTKGNYTAIFIAKGRKSKKEIIYLR